MTPTPHQERLRDFDLLVLRHLPSALNLARWYVRNDDDAKDLVQEAMLRAFKAFATFRGHDGRIWLFTIIRNLYFSAVARKQPEPAVFDEETHPPQEPVDNPELILLRQTDSQTVRKAIESLSADVREVLILRELEGLSYKEIADVTKVPLGTVMSRLYRAREQLRQYLASYYAVKRVG
ncbi:MAG TPA: sigma-70 family RNA polymerase sigma factor [Candidatus Angelobacter sp.]|nr:sigma-70 family RNA polymerase sigma factor [Candidatus Angelobacter sp.]